MVLDFNVSCHQHGFVRLLQVPSASALPWGGVSAAKFMLGSDEARAGCAVSMCGSLGGPMGSLGIIFEKLIARLSQVSDSSDPAAAEAALTCQNAPADNLSPSFAPAQSCPCGHRTRYTAARQVGERTGKGVREEKRTGAKGSVTHPS